jgi:hypothetical protein
MNFILVIVFFEQKLLMLFITKFVTEVSSFKFVNDISIYLFIQVKIQF